VLINNKHTRIVRKIRADLSSVCGEHFRNKLLSRFKILENAFNKRWNELDILTSLSYFIPSLTFIHFHKHILDNFIPSLIFGTRLSSRSCPKTRFGHKWQPHKKGWYSIVDY